MDLVVISLEAWDGVWRRNQHLVAGLLRRDPSLRVLFVEPAADPLHAALGDGRPRAGRGLRPAPVLDGVDASALWLFEPTKWLPRRVDRRTDERWARQVLKAARSLALRDPMLWVNDPRGALILEATSWPALYDVTDDWTLAERAPAATQRIKTQERVLLRRCDEVVVCSSALAVTKGAERPVTLVPNGVDAAAYAREHDRPADVPPGPVALYVGTLHDDRLDVELCAETARALVGVGHLVLVGPNALTAAQRSRLGESGAVVLGSRRAEDVPGYLQHADVLVVPHVVTPFTDSLDPIKLYEYQAAARRVVATPVAGFRDLADDLVVVVDRADFPGVVTRALCAGTSGDRAAPVATDRVAAIDWSRRVDQMAEVLVRLAGEVVS